MVSNNGKNGKTYLAIEKKREEERGRGKKEEEMNTKKPLVANTFTKQVGYGNAIGFLVNKGIPVEIPKDEHNLPENINPITGQYLSAEDSGPALADMTDEEKEREAEKLFVLFERLKKTGVVDVENPIAKAMREGKLENTQKEDTDSD